MSKRLKAPRYKKLIAYLESIMNNPKETDKSRTTAAYRLDDLYARLEMADERAAMHRRKLELLRLQVENPSLPVPATEPEAGQTRDDQIASVFRSVMPGEAS
jgi:hypothetical protein